MTTRRIFIEGMGLVDEHFSGVGQYILGVLRGLDDQLDRIKTSGAPAPEVFVVIPRDSTGRFASFGFRHLQPKRIPLSFHRASKLWNRGRMFPLDLWCGRGVYIFPRFVDMPLLFSRSAVVVYDLSFERFPEFAEPRTARFLSEGVRRSVERASRVITISGSARDELVRFYGLPSDKVVVATPAADPALFHRRSDDEIAAVKERYGVTGDYLLSLSNVEPRKNIDGLIDAYCALPARLRDTVSLLLVGQIGWRAKALEQKILDRTAEGFRIVRPSHFVADADRPALLSGAKLLVYPSHYEGFGLPALEALACGVPVITADNSSLPEAVGDVGILVKSGDTVALRDAIAAALRELPALSARVRIDGPAHAARFSWLASARVFLDVAMNL